MRRQTSNRIIVAGLTLAATVIFSSSALAANSVVLEKISFEDHRGNTDIVLHTESEIPYNVVMTSSNKLVIDLNNVNAERTIRTNFIKAGNVSHVVMQPLNESKIRLIVRGKNLGRPAISFDNDATGQPGQLKLTPSQARALEQESKNLMEEIDNYNAIDKYSDDLYEEASVGSADGKLVIDDNGEDVTIAGAAAPTELSDTESISYLPEELLSEEPSETTASNDFISPESLLDDAPAEAPQPLNLDTETSQPEESSAPSLPFSLPFEAFNWQLGAFLGLLIGLGVFLKNKLSSLRAGQSNNGGFGDLLNAKTAAANKGFQSVSNAYQDLNNRVEEANQPQSPIGLGGLGFVDTEIERQRPVAQRPNQPSGASKQAALNQYKQQSQSVPKTRKQPVAKQPVNQDVLKQEIQRSAEVKSQLGLDPTQRKVRRNQMPNAQPALKKQRPQPQAQQAAPAQAKAPKQQVKQPGDNKIFNAALDAILNTPQAEKKPARKPKKAVQTKGKPQPPSAKSRTSKNRKQSNRTFIYQTPEHHLDPKGQGAPNPNNPLPENPQVLDFLRDVANIMEQEGNTRAASTIQRNLNTI